ncbi:Crp/Fnr family transcriptional regulator [Pedobacter panaciterrae]|uniref:Crp/Fnr family transcriptional regulator n=1 Tax=Pedobacter panaciterrae TaxID=363849 RepID=UPI00259A5156|nr:Crp/Fnr family transcriptional regulator [uncultured Pedobacter sp.]
MSLRGIFPIDKWDFKSDSIFTNFPAEDYEEMTLHAREEKYKKGQTIFREGGIPSGIYYILEGKVKKYKVDNFEKEQIIYVANAGELIGYHAVLSTERYPDSATALEECIVLFIPKEDFLKVQERSTLLSTRLLKMLSHEFTVLSNSITIFAQRPVRERLAIALIVLREKFKKGTLEGQPIVINLSREDIANMVGTTRENTVRLLREFKNENLIETKGRKIRILDIRKMVAVSNYQ